MATLAQAIDAINNLTNAVNTKIQDIDSRIAAKENEVTQFLLNAPDSYMKKEFYVDAVNGSDTNDGSSGAPFASIKKAVDSIPIGGYGSIYLLDGVHSIDSEISVVNKHIRILTDAVQTSAEIRFKSYIDYAGSNRVYSLVATNSLISITGQYGNNNVLKIVSAELADSTAGVNDDMGVFDLHSSALLLDFLTLEVSSNPLAWSYNYLPSAFPHSRVGIGGVDVNFINDNVSLLNTTGTVFSFSMHTSNLKNSAGTDISDVASKIAGVVRDANGVPRNIVSNIVL